ncbi:locomotion-related protein Hikaru genki [Nilaparvata lugens]|uniref:locomotion-related protein Hikaru genki n=1 Tax=Nilaparvata lugens TaxID=108931 RepID=UPI00193DDE60|nr:locomotion-related protein Hikaru genki [Nilaparvata lugens]
MAGHKLYAALTLALLTFVHGRLRNTEWKGVGCPPPGVSVNGSRVVPRPGAAPDYSTLSEVKFPAELPSPSILGPDRRLCKIKCIGGRWVGPLCRQEQEQGRFQPLLRSCTLDMFPLHLVLTYKNTTITTNNEVFPHNAEVQLRCREPLGLYKLLGESRLQCNNGAWSSRVPSCIPTTVLTNYTEDSPPTILVRIPSGSASVEPSGSLAVFPGSILHLECLFPRKTGTPEWTWTSSFRQYLTGWAIAAEERDWKYRLSIYYTKMQDSGVFTCATPRGLTNSLTLRITAVHCESLDRQVEADKQLKAHVEGTRLGQSAIFQCPVGFRLNGTANLTCQASGEWSSRVPHCEPIRCPQLEVTDGSGLEMVEQNTSYGGRAVFNCAFGFRMSGPPGLECELDGRWSGLVPNCTRIQCPPPIAPQHGRVVEESTPDDAGVYSVGAVVQFACLPHARLFGEASIVCTETGFWSQPAPLCKPGCEYPGEPENGLLAPLKFWYESGDKLQVSCNAGFVSPLQTSPVCREDGSWDPPMPNCTDYTEV